MNYLNNGSVILDVGSGSIKAGRGSDDSPSSIIPSLIGRAKYKCVMMTGSKLGYIGNDAMKRRGILDLEYPIRRGIVQDFDDLELLFEYIFENELKINPKELSIFITDSLLNPHSNREKIAELLFETFNFPALYFEHQPLVSLYSSGRSCGIVVHSGEGLSQIVSISNGYVLPQTIRRLNLGGFDLTENFRKLLNQKGHYFKTKAEFEIVRELKEKCAVIKESSSDDNTGYSGEMNSSSFELPDGNRIEIGDERYEIGEALFNPHKYLGLDSLGLDKLVTDSIHTCEIDTQRDMYNNVILVGGNSRIPNFSTRIEREIEKNSPPSLTAKSFTLSLDSYPEWIGALIMILQSEMNNLWFTRGRYEEFGRSFVHNHGESY